MSMITRSLFRASRRSHLQNIGGSTPFHMWMSRRGRYVWGHVCTCPHRKCMGMCLHVYRQGKPVRRCALPLSPFQDSPALPWMVPPALFSVVPELLSVLAPCPVPIHCLVPPRGQCPFENLSHFQATEKCSRSPWVGLWVFVDQSAF